MREITYSGKLTVVEGIIGVITPSGHEGDVNICLTTGAPDSNGIPAYEQGDPWLTVSEKDLGKSWPPLLGDVVTLIIPKIIELKREK